MPVSDTDNDRVLELNSRGDVLIVWGSSHKSDSQFIQPGGIALDGKGNRFVGDLD